MIRIKPGQKIVEAGQTGSHGDKKFYIVWRGALTVQKQTAEVTHKDALKEPLTIRGHHTPGINCAAHPARGPDSHIRMQSGLGGPAWESKAVATGQLSNAHVRFDEWKKEVDRRRHGDSYVTEVVKEAAHHKTLEGKHAAELREDSLAFKAEEPKVRTERTMGYVHEGSGFGEAECVLQGPFQSSAVARHVAEAHDSHAELEAKPKDAGMIVLVEILKSQLPIKLNICELEIVLTFENFK